MNFQDQFKSARNQLGDTQEGAAGKLGVSIGAVQSWERKANPSKPGKHTLTGKAAMGYIRRAMQHAGQ